MHRASSLGFFATLTSDSHYFYQFQEFCLPLMAHSTLPAPNLNAFRKIQSPKTTFPLCVITGLKTKAEQPPSTFFPQSKWSSSHCASLTRLLQLRAMLFHISLWFSLEFIDTNIHSSLLQAFLVKRLSATDLVSNIHPMEVHSALLLKVMYGWVFAAHKAFSHFWTGFCHSCEVSGICPVASHWK